MLTSIETCAAVAYAINLLITALGTDAEVETSVYYIGTMLIVISSMLWVFVLSSIYTAWDCMLKKFGWKQMTMLK